MLSSLWLSTFYFLNIWLVTSWADLGLSLSCTHYFTSKLTQDHPLKTVYSICVGIKVEGKERATFMNIVKLLQPLTSLCFVSQGVQKRLAGYPSQCGLVAALPDLH